MATSYENPVLLLERVGKDPKFQLHKENLQNVVGKLGETPVSILSIVGISPQNKNLVVGYFLAYLESLVGTISTETAESNTLNSFLWKDSHIPDPEIAATWIFTSPIIIKSSNNEEIAVIILYTQLPNEYLSTADKNVDSIISLNMLISSTIVIDCYREISTKLVKRLGQCIEFGLNGIGEKICSSGVFQTLSLLIRDWNYPIDYPYGDVGGTNYLERILVLADQSKKVKEKFEKSFKTLNCHLIPFPGAQAMSSKFTGKSTELDNLYLKFLQNFINNFIKNIVPSKIRGENITGSSLLVTIESLIKGLNDGAPKTVSTKGTKKLTDNRTKLQKAHSEDTQEKPSDKRKKRKGSKVRLNSEGSAAVGPTNVKNEKPLQVIKKEQSPSTPPRNLRDCKQNFDSTVHSEAELQLVENLTSNNNTSAAEKDVQPKKEDDSLPTSKKQLVPNTKPKDHSFTNEKIVAEATEKFKSLMKKSIVSKPLECISDADCIEIYEKAAKTVRSTIRKKLPAAGEEKDVQYKSFRKVFKEKTREEFEPFQKEIQIKRKLCIDEHLSQTLKEFHKILQSATNDLNQKEFDLNQTKLNLTKELRDKLKLFGDTEEVLKELETQFFQIETDWKRQHEKSSKPTPEFSYSDLQKVISEYQSNMERALDVDEQKVETTLEKLHSNLHNECIAKLNERVGDRQSPFYVQLSEAIEAKYKNFISKFIAEQEENGNIKNEILSIQLQQAYAEELTQQKENTERSVEELTNKHSTRTTEILQKFNENCLYFEESILANVVMESLKNKLNLSFKAHLNELQIQRKERETHAQNALDAALIFYDTGMTQLLRTNYFLEQNDLENEETNISSNAIHTYLDTLKTYNIPTSMATSEEILKLKFSQAFLKFKKENDDNRKLAISETHNLVAECLKDYNTSMSKRSIFIWNNETLENLHEESKQQAISNLRAKCVKKTGDFLQPYLQELQNDITAAFSELQEFFELKFNHENDTINEALSKGRRVYNDEMDKHFKNHEFIKPETLENLHKDVSARAVKYCFETNVFLEESHKLQLQEGMNLIFEKYEQQNNMNLQIESAIGIDLGTTYCCVAVYAKGKIHVVRNSVGKNTTPSYVAFDTNGKETVGDAAKSRAYENPEATIFDAKRIIGRRFDDMNLQHDATLWPFSIVDDLGVPKILIGDKTLHPEEIAAKLLSQLKRDAETYLQRDVCKAVITVPAYFTDGQRQATKDAGVMAGFDVLNVQNEPTAAAIAYKLQHYEGREKNVLIFDLGGGTFDVAVLKMSKGNIDVLAVDGDTHLGGEDFDKNMMNYCAQEFKKLNNIDLFEGKDSDVKQEKDQARRRLKRLQGECERKKIELGAARVTDVIVDRMHGNLDLSVSVTREVFEHMNDSLFQKTIEVVDKVLFDAKLNKTQIDDIVLVGGSTRIPKVQELLINYFEGKALNNFINPDEAVAYGAAMTAAYMNGTIARNSMDFNRIQDVTPMSIGVEVYGGAFSVIIPKSTKIPVKAMERYRTAHNNQTSVQITIYQGEDRIAVKNQHLGDFYLNEIPPKPAEVENIDVEMVINSQGILHVSAVSSSTGQKSVSIIENKFRMEKGAIQRYLQQGSI